MESQNDKKGKLEEKEQEKNGEWLHGQYTVEVVGLEERVMLPPLSKITHKNYLILWCLK
jgi:hypothetical protein